MRGIPFILSIAFLTLLLLEGETCTAQRDTVYTDTLNIAESELPKHSPTRATIYSMVVPGLGQAYNRKYWKIPIIYAGIGIPLYYGLQEHREFEEKRDAYVNRINGDSSDVFLEAGNFFSNDALLTSMDISRRNRDLMVIIAAGIYVLQIVDAAVDAHLFYFNVSDDLSIHYQPIFNYDPRTGIAHKGIGLNLTF